MGGKIMEEVRIIINQISILTLLGLIGFIAGKTNYLPQNAGIVISKVVVKLTAPFLIFVTLAKKDFSMESITSILGVLVLGTLFLIAAFLISSFGCKILKLEGATANIYKMHSVFGMSFILHIRCSVHYLEMTGFSMGLFFRLLTILFCGLWEYF